MSNATALLPQDGTDPRGQHLAAAVPPRKLPGGYVPQENGPSNCLWVSAPRVCSPTRRAPLRSAQELAASIGDLPSADVSQDVDAGEDV